MTGLVWAIISYGLFMFASYLTGFMTPSLNVDMAAIAGLVGGYVARMFEVG